VIKYLLSEVAKFRGDQFTAEIIQQLVDEKQQVNFSSSFLVFAFQHGVVAAAHPPASDCRFYQGYRDGKLNS
jgi:hypothetical protein